jgi:hypothetical protein
MPSKGLLSKSNLLVFCVLATSKCVKVAEYGGTACNPNPQETEAGLQIEYKPCYISRSCFTKTKISKSIKIKSSRALVTHPCNPTWEAEIRRISVQSQPGQIV